MLSYEEYKKLLGTDLTEIDKEIERAPVYFQDICEKTVELWKDYETLEVQVKTLEADTWLKFKSAAEKITVDDLKARVSKDADVYRARDLAIHAEAEYRKWMGLKESFQAKIEGIQNIVKLINSSYCSYKK